MLPDGRVILAARGSEPSDLVFINARIANVFTGEIETGDVAIIKGRIAGIGNYRNAKQIIDLKNRFLVPALIDGHIHQESSMLDIGQYARAVVPHGTLSIITDLHEIANVSGMEGIRYILNSARRYPLDLFLMAPACVPATHLETSGATIGLEEIRKLLRFKECIGLGEVMNFPGVLFAEPLLLGKLKLAGHKVIDGHSPGIFGNDLNAYISAGISSDHESVSFEEAREKLQRGMRVMIREGSSEKNLDALLPIVTDKTYKRCLFVVDDRACADLLREGDMDAVVRKAIKRGLDPIRAIQLATINTAEYFSLGGLGAIAPGYSANLLVLDDLMNFNINMVFYHGNLVAEAGKPLFPATKSKAGQISNTVKMKLIKQEDLVLMKSSSGIEHVIEIVPGQIITKKRLEKMEPVNGVVVPDLNRDILKLVVVERHKRIGNIGLGLVKGFGLNKGALASSIAHDSHNIVSVGTNDEDILVAIKEIERMQGGLVVSAEGKVISRLALPIAGLLSDQPLESVVSILEELEGLAKNLGCMLSSPFATLSFLPLPVIPELRLTDLGMVDVKQFKLLK
jgi:adenine deaminase